MTTIRWGIIGCGDVTEVKSGPAFAKARHSALVAVMRRTSDLARDYARRHGVARWYDDAEALVHDAEVDAVYVATPPDTHGAYTRLAAAAGKPVYVEKPMARRLHECREMIEACRAASVPLFTAYYRRALPRFVRVKTLLDDGAIGAPRVVTVTLTRRHQRVDGALPWRLVPSISGGGLFVDLASHTLDLLDFLLGPLTDVQGGAANVGGFHEAEDLVSAVFTCEGRVHGTGVWCFDADRDADQVEIVGTMGRVRFSTFDEHPLHIERHGRIETEVVTHPAHVQQPLIQTVVDELMGVGRCPSTGESGARATAVMDTLLSSYYAAR